MQKWEYMTLNIMLRIDESSDEVDRRLNLQGNEGWELVNMDWEFNEVRDRKTTMIHAVFKRPIES